jgi:hypothetical protein
MPDACAARGRARGAADAAGLERTTLAANDRGGQTGDGAADQPARRRVEQRVMQPLPDAPGSAVSGGAVGGAGQRGVAHQREGRGAGDGHVVVPTGTFAGDERDGAGMAMDPRAVHPQDIVHDGRRVRRDAVRHAGRASARPETGQIAHQPAVVLCKCLSLNQYQLWLPPAHIGM